MLEPLETDAVTYDPTFRAPFSEETEVTVGAVLVSKSHAQEYGAQLKHHLRFNQIPVKTHLVDNDAIAYAPIVPDDVESMNRLIRIVNHVFKGHEPKQQLNGHIAAVPTKIFNGEAVKVGPEVKRSRLTPEQVVISDDVPRESIKYKWDLLKQRGDWFLLKHHTLQQASSNANYFMKRTGHVVKCHEVSDGVMIIMVEERRA